MIDEVDVFFSKEFYGSSYCPQTNIQHVSIKNLCDYIWENKEVKLYLKQIKETTQYKDVTTAFPGWGEVIDEAIKSMLDSVHNYEQQDYVVSKEVDKIGYKEQDNIVYNVTFGYKTMFAYFHENL